jgi:hypothetical protein
MGEVKSTGGKNMKKRILMLAICLIFLASISVAEELTWQDFGDGIRFKWSEPETAATKKGDELARQRIARESAPPSDAGIINGYSWAERELIEAKVEYLRNAGKVEIIQVNQGFIGGNLHQRQGQFKGSRAAGHGRRRR